MFKWKVGDGEKLRFCQDTWIGNQSSEISFPRLFLNSNQKDQTIKEMGKWEESG